MKSFFYYKIVKNNKSLTGYDRLLIDNIKADSLSDADSLFERLYQINPRKDFTIVVTITKKATKLIEEK